MFSDFFIKRVLCFLPLKLLSLSYAKPLLPFYHSVNDQTPSHIKHLYDSRRIAVFNADVNWLLQHYNPITLDDLYGWIYNNKILPKNCFHLSFDDGFVECYEIIRPILKRMGVPATFFICSDFLDNKNMFFRNKVSLLIDRFAKTLSQSEENEIRKMFVKQSVPYRSFSKAMIQITSEQSPLVEKIADFFGFSFEEYLEKEQPYLNSEQVDSLIRDGFSIGAHSIDHPHYKYLSIDDQLKQTKQSIDFISSRFSLSCKAFSFPHSDDGVPLNFYREASRDVDLFFGTARMKTDEVRFSLQRFSLEDSRYSCSEIVKGNFLRQDCLAMVRKSTISRNL